MGGGSWPSDVSWTLTCSGALIGSGGAPYSGTLSAPPGECTLDMYDSYGDGWNGNLWEGAGYTFTFDSGSYGSATFTLTALPPSSPPSPSLPPLPPLPGYCFATSAVASKAVVVPKIVGPKIVGGVPVDPARKYVPDPPSRANAALRSPPAAVC